MATKRPKRTKQARPAAAKGNFIRRITLTSTMGPAVRIDNNVALNLTVK